MGGKREKPEDIVLKLPKRIYCYYQFLNLVHEVHFLHVWPSSQANSDKTVAFAHAPFGNTSSLNTLAKLRSPQLTAQPSRLKPSSVFVV